MRKINQSSILPRSGLKMWEALLILAYAGMLDAVNITPGENIMYFTRRRGSTE